MQFSSALFTVFAVASASQPAARSYGSVCFSLPSAYTKADVYFQPTHYCQDPYDAVELLRAFSIPQTDHFYTTDASEMNIAVNNLGYSREGNAARVFTAEGGSTIPLYRIFRAADTDHFYTTNAAERASVIAGGASDEGIAAWIYPDDSCEGTVPFYRLFSPSADDHFYTTDASERANAINNLAYSDEGIIGYVLPA